MNEVSEINIDTVRELRLRGLYEEADKVLKSYHEDKLKNKIQLKKEIRTIYAQIYRNKNKEACNKASRERCIRKKEKGYTKEQISLDIIRLPIHKKIISIIYIPINISDEGKLL